MPWKVFYFKLHMYLNQHWRTTNKKSTVNRVTGQRSRFCIF